MKKNAYKLVLAPHDWRGRRYRKKYCFEHQLVYWQHTGVMPKRGYHIHHINKDKTDNRFENLERLTVKEHWAKHNHKCWHKCPICGKAFNAPAQQVCCSRQCAGKNRTK